MPDPYHIFTVQDPTAGTETYSPGEYDYTPQVGAAQEINLSQNPDSIGVTVGADDYADVVTGIGNDYLTLLWGGNDIADGGSGMNFITGSYTADDFIQAEPAAAMTIDTIANFHTGDQLDLTGNFATVQWKTWAGMATLTAIQAGSAPIVAYFPSQSVGQFQTDPTPTGLVVTMPQT